MNHFRIIYKYVQHLFSARHTWGFSVHSPFLYQFTRYVLCEKNLYYFFHSVEKLRACLLKDIRTIDIRDFGTGHDRVETVSQIARKSLSNPRHGQLLFRMVHYFKAQNVLELGTSLGLTTSYLAASSTGIRCVSLEGSPQLAEIARENLRKLEVENVDIVVGNIDDTLNNVLSHFEKLDFVFFDANHSYDAVLNYFDMCLSKVHNKTVFVIDDIYWSEEMELAWTKIKTCPRVTSTIDLFQMGLVFFNSDLNNKSYKMRY